MKGSVHVTGDANGLRVHYTDSAGKESSIPLTIEGGLELVAEITKKIHELRSSPAMQEAAGGALARTLFNWLGKK